MTDDTPKAGHNSFKAAADRLRSIVERIERLNDEIVVLRDDVKDIYSEAKSAGYNVKVLRKLIALRKRNTADVQIEQEELDKYQHALDS